MKRKMIIAISLVSLLILASCAKKNTQGTISPEILIAVGQTLTAQYTPAAATVTPTPSETATPLGSPTVGIPTVNAFPTSTSSCDNSQYVADVTIPDGTILAKSTAFTKTWTLRNNGSCTWSATYKLKFVSGDQMSGTTVDIGKSVAPGETIDISIDMISPSTAGTYTGYWRLVNDSATNFGQAVSVEIVVSSAAATTITPIIIVVTATPEPLLTPVP